MRAILMILSDTLLFYENSFSTFCDSIPEPRTIRTINFFKLEADTIYYWTKYYEMRARISMKNDTLIHELIIDSKNPDVMIYGYGTITYKYLKYDGAVPPQNWPQPCL
jgi:hypothetical protein